MGSPIQKRRNMPARPRWIAVAAIAVLALGAWWYLRGGGPANSGRTAETTFTATRGPLDITVLEGGTIEALESLDIKSEVQGVTKILTLVEEGHQITAADIAKKLVLVQLDSKDLLDRLTEQELSYQTALASLADARESLQIQRNQNESDIKQAELKVKFGLSDLTKFLGEDVANEILTARGIKDIALGDFKPAPLAASGEAEKAVPIDPQGAVPIAAPSADAAAAAAKAGNEPSMLDRLANLPEIDFMRYADAAKLGDGQARQMLRKYENDLTLSTQQVGLAQTQVGGTKRLFDRDFVTKNELDNDELKLKQQVVAQESTKTDRELFIKYEFPKQAEKWLADYEEALRMLERTRRQAVSRLAQAEARLNSAEASHALQKRNRDLINKQIEKCTIRAEREGMVIYGTGEDSWNDADRIQEGATVRERQVIIRIPDTTKMGVKVRVHESFVKRVRKDQTVRIRVDANPDIQITGQVVRIAVLADSANRWMNPDLKLYTTMVSIDGQYDWLKPGMNAQVEILCDRINDAVQVPIQAVQHDGDDSVCYVARGMSNERRVVTTGEFNTSMIEIRSGLKPGEVVRLLAPDWEQAASGGDDELGKDESPKKKDGSPKKKNDAAATRKPEAAKPAPANP